MQLPELTLPDDPKLAENITHFARALRRAGLPVGTHHTLDAIRAVEAVGFTDKTDFYWTLHACFVSRPDHAQVFTQLFRMFWRDPKQIEDLMAIMLPAMSRLAQSRPPDPGDTRASAALTEGTEPPDAPEDESSEETEIEIDASRTMSAEERLRSLDFEQMTVEEAAAARRMLARLTLPVAPLRTRRAKPSPQGARIDTARTLRNAVRNGGEMRKLSYSVPRLRWPALVTICDISGSMSQYSRMVLHFLHAVANEKGAGWAKVHGFTFGTRLTNITRHFLQRDVDAALAAAGAEAQDWEGGTRIGDCLHTFNRDWSRRVMGQGAVVLLITDGLDRGDPDLLAAEMKRLHLSARRVIWLNPLLRWDGFAPKARGIAAMLPHVDSLRAGHSIKSLEDLAMALSDRDDRGEKDRLLRALSD